MTARCFALIPAAGSGTRAGSSVPKQYLPIAGRPMLMHTVAAFAAVPAIERIVVVVAPDDRRIDAMAFDPGRVRVAKAGGATRAATVANGLASMADLASDDDWVLVHDAARCGIDSAAIATMIGALANEPVGGLLAMPVDDTLKRSLDVDGRPTVSATVDRAGLWRAQTPQMFRFRLLCDALSASDAAFTDEAGAIEAAGHRPRLIVGSPRNFKVTTSDDLALMTLCLETSPT